MQGEMGELKKNTTYGDMGRDKLGIAIWQIASQKKREKIWNSKWQITGQTGN